MTAKIEKTAAILHDARARGRAAVGRRAGAGRRERVSVAWAPRALPVEKAAGCAGSRPGAEPRVQRSSRWPRQRRRAGGPGRGAGRGGRAARGRGKRERERARDESGGRDLPTARSPGTPTSPLCGFRRGGVSGTRPRGRTLNMSRGRNPLGRSTHSIDSSPGARACCCLRSAMTRLHAAASRSLRARFAVVLARFARAEGSPAVARHIALSGLSPSLSPLESLAPHPLQCSRRLARPETL